MSDLHRNPPAVNPATLDPAEQTLLCEILNRDPEGGVWASPANLHRFVLRHAEQQVRQQRGALNAHGRTLADGILMKLAGRRG